MILSPGCRMHDVLRLSSGLACGLAEMGDGVAEQLMPRRGAMVARRPRAAAAKLQLVLLASCGGVGVMQARRRLATDPGHSRAGIAVPSAMEPARNLSSVLIPLAIGSRRLRTLRFRIHRERPSVASRPPGSPLVAATPFLEDVLTTVASAPILERGMSSIERIDEVLRESADGRPGTVGIDADEPDQGFPGWDRCPFIGILALNCRMANTSSTGAHGLDTVARRIRVAADQLHLAFGVGEADNRGS